MTTSAVDRPGTRRLLDLLTPAEHRPRPDPEGQPPTEAELELLVRAAAAVPDHGGLRPWRFVAVAGEARARLGDALAADVPTFRPDAPAALVEKARRKAFAAPALLLLIASPHPGSNVPEWEQVASAACCGYAVVLAAGALGLGAVWKSTSFREGPALRDLCRLGPDEQLLGWINVGTLPSEPAADRRPGVDTSSLLTTLPAS